MITTPNAAPEHRSGTEAGPVLSVSDLTKTYGRGDAAFKAVRGVSFDIHRGETLGLVGESGCGKSTTARAVLSITPPTSGRVALGDRVLTDLRGRELRDARSRMQLVFQDPYHSVNPRWTVRRVVAEPLRLAGRRANESRPVVDEALALVGLEPERFGDRSARQLSGGQAQRVGIARALVTEPELLVCDEAVSALDVSVQAQTLNLLTNLKSQLELTTLFISHDLGVVRHICDRVAVMYRGRIVEIGHTDQIFDNPRHPYTAMLLGSVLEVGMPPKTYGVPDGDGLAVGSTSGGCAFADRCPSRGDICVTQDPELVGSAGAHPAACHYPLDNLTLNERCER